MKKPKPNYAIEVDLSDVVGEPFTLGYGDTEVNRAGSKQRLIHKLVPLIRCGGFLCDNVEECESLQDNGSWVI